MFREQYLILLKHSLPISTGKYTCFMIYSTLNLNPCKQTVHKVIR